MAEEFKPDETEQHPSSDGGLTLIFRRDSGETRSIVLGRGQVAALAAALIGEIGTDRVVPIDRASLRIGQPFAVEGFQVAHSTDGGRCLIVQVHLPDQGRVVTIPLELSPQDVAALIEQLR